MTYDVLALQFQRGCECIKGGQARLSPDTERDGDGEGEEDGDGDEGGECD